MKRKICLAVPVFLFCAILVEKAMPQDKRTDAENANSVADDRPQVRALACPPLGAVRFEGRVGAELDKVVGARIRSALAAEQILPEAVEAFRKQEDDRVHDGRGMWQGEFWGKWMLSAVAAQRYTGDQKLKRLVRKGVDDLLATQRADGYIGTYHDSGFVEGNCWNVWCRKYTLWGLVDAYELLGDPKILSAASRHMDHLMTEVGPGKTDIVKTGNFYGLPSCSILTPVLKLYRHTQDERYLEYGRYIVAQWSKYPGDPPDIVNRGLEGKPVHEWFPDAGRWTKAYEFISCVEGLVDLYEIDGNENYLRAAENVYDAIRLNERVITGGIGYHDKLAGAAFRTDGLNEPCDVVYWERLSARLLQLTGKPTYADEIERLMYNVLMSVVSRDGSWGLRRLGLSEPHLISVLHCFLHHHHCCIANVPRGFLQLAEVAVMIAPEDGAVVVNLYIPGRAGLVLPSGDQVIVLTETDYPESGKVRLSVETEAPQAFPLRLRIPPWSGEAAASVNGKPIDDIKPGEYVTIARTWRSGDRVELDLDVRARLDPFAGGRTHAAIVRGPVVLARSELLGDERIDDAVDLGAAPGDVVSLRRADPPKGIWMAFEVTAADGHKIRLCDYSSTGKDYSKPTDPTDMKWMASNRTSDDLRVWLPLAGTAAKQ